MMNPSNYPPGVTGCEPQITGEDYCDRCALFDEAIAALRLAQKSMRSVNSLHAISCVCVTCESIRAVLRKVDHPTNEKG